MNRTFAIAIVGLALCATPAAAQTVMEEAHILRDFERNVVEYTQRYKCLDMSHEALSAAAPAPRMFTLPVAMVFRQRIARALAAPHGGEAMAGPGGRTVHHPVVLQPFPGNELYDFPKVLRDALPPVPAPLEYRLIDHDLVIRDTGADVIVAVLRDALGPFTTR